MIIKIKRVDSRVANRKQKKISKEISEQFDIELSKIQREIKSTLFVITMPDNVDKDEVSKLIRNELNDDVLIE